MWYREKVRNLHFKKMSTFVPFQKCLITIPMFFSLKVYAPLKKLVDYTKIFDPERSCVFKNYGFITEVIIIVPERLCASSKDHHMLESAYLCDLFRKTLSSKNYGFITEVIIVPERLCASSKNHHTLESARFFSLKKPYKIQPSN